MNIPNAAKILMSLGLSLTCLGCATPLCDSIMGGADQILAVHAPAPRAPWRPSAQPIETGWAIDSGLSEAAIQARTCEHLEQSLWLNYRRFDFSAVRETANQLINTEGVSARQRATAYLLAGCATCVEGKVPEAREAFGRAIAEDPAVTPDENLFPTYVCALYRETLEGMSKSVRQTVYIP